MGKKFKVEKPLTEEQKKMLASQTIPKVHEKISIPLESLNLVKKEKIEVTVEPLNLAKKPKRKEARKRGK